MAAHPHIPPRPPVVPLSSAPGRGVLSHCPWCSHCPRSPVGTKKLRIVPTHSNPFLCDLGPHLCLTHGDVHTEAVWLSHFSVRPCPLILWFLSPPPLTNPCPRFPQAHTPNMLSPCSEAFRMRLDSPNSLSRPRCFSCLRRTCHRPKVPRATRTNKASIGPKIRGS